MREEMWAHHEPRGAQYMGVNWVGPAIMAFGTDAQKAHHLGAISAGDVIWCQGFSEPDAGSDLASLTTRATRRSARSRPTATAGGSTGQKIWTSYAGMAQWCVLAARVRPEHGTAARSPRSTRASRCSSCPWTLPGITVQPIHSSLGPAPPQRGVLRRRRGRRRRGAGRSRAGLAGDAPCAVVRARRHRAYARCDRLLSALEAELGERFDDLPATVRAAWTRALVAVRVARLLNYRAIHLQAEGVPADTAASAARIAVTQADQLVAEALFHALDATSLRDKRSGGPLHGAIEDHYRYAQAATVASGTIEIQRMIVGRATLGAPAPCPNGKQAPVDRDGHRPPRARRRPRRHRAARVRRRRWRRPRAARRGRPRSAGRGG